jgi:hypothetical protein
MAQHADDDEASFVPSTRNSQLLHEEPHKRAKTGHLSRSEWDGRKQSPIAGSTHEVPDDVNAIGRAGHQSYTRLATLMV